MPTTTKNPSGLAMHYDVTGSGDPIIVLPGGMMTNEMMGGLIAALATSRKVIAVEPQAHGRTKDIDRPMTYEHMADDVAALVAELNLGAVDVCGFSVGAGIALQMAIRHSASVRNLVFLSGVFKGDAEYAELRAIVATFVPDHPMLKGMRDAYVHAAGSADGWPALVEKMRTLLDRPYDWSAQVAKVTAPTLIVAADSDTAPVQHSVDLFKLMGGETPANAMGGKGRAQLAILPGTNHFAFVQRADLLGPIIHRFLQ